MQSIDYVYICLFNYFLFEPPIFDSTTSWVSCINHILEKQCKTWLQRPYKATLVLSCREVTQALHQDISFKLDSKKWMDQHLFIIKHGFMDGHPYIPAVEAVKLSGTGYHPTRGTWI